MISHRRTQRSRHEWAEKNAPQDKNQTLGLSQHCPLPLLPQWLNFPLIADYNSPCGRKHSYDKQSHLYIKLQLLKLYRQDCSSFLMEKIKHAMIISQ